MSAGELILLNQGRLKTCEMLFTPNQAKRMGSSGNSVVTTLGPSRWRLQVASAQLTMAQARLWTAWLARRESFTFTAPRLMRVQPAGTIGTADGAIGLTVDIPNSELDLTGVGAYTAKIGDMISYRTAANGYWIGEIQADAAASAGNITVAVLPRPVAKHASAPAVRRVQALGEFELITDPAAIDVYDTRVVQFEAMQVLR